jgi:hypothetical protein
MRPPGRQTERRAPYTATPRRVMWDNRVAARIFQAPRCSPKNYRTKDRRYT